MMRVSKHPALAIGALLLLQACGGGSSTTDSNNASSETLPLSAGQVASPAATPRVTFYAASRFAEQASFGPTPALVAEIRSKGFEKWIDEQFALPESLLDPTVAESSYKLTTLQQVPNSTWEDLDTQFMRKAMSAPDQLRWRLMWSISNYIVVSRGKGDTPAGNLHWVNMLYRQGLGNYRDLLREVSLNPFMAHYLDNDQNRPKSSECPQCAPNENYARELMQLFTIGVLNLNADGTPVLDSRGRLQETYTQTDVEELARVLTGWTFNPEPKTRPARNWGNWDKPMSPSTWPPERDSGRKVVMGRVFPAGQSTAADLEDTLSMLMDHPNIALFVSLRLIQHLVKSDPSPAYLQRVAGIFRNNGRGVVGDLKAVVKAILLDSEARRGDEPAKALAGDGKFREPFLHRAAALRGLGCKEFGLQADGSSTWTVWWQRLLFAESVFGYYSPTDRAAGSNLLAPEQGLVNASELTERLSFLNALRWNATTNSNSLAAFERAGCSAGEFVQAYVNSPAAFLDLVSLRYFRGAMPPTLRSSMEQLIRKPQWNASDPSEGTMRMLAYALSVPTYGVVK